MSISIHEVIRLLVGPLMKYRISARSILLTFMSLLALGGSGIFYWGLSDLSSQLLTLDQSRLQGSARFRQNVIFYDQKGKFLSQWNEYGRFYTSLDNIPVTVQQAFIAAEDQRFFYHRGFDIRAVLRSIIANIRAGFSQQGASTLTQQLARSLFLGREKTFYRKIREMILALALEWRYEKKEILELYLNHIFLGPYRPGITNAAAHFFGKRPNELSLAEAALLAGLTRAPARYSPHRDLDRAWQRRKWVLDRMLDLDFIDQAAHMRANQMVLAPDRLETRSDPRLGFANQLIHRHFRRHFSNLQRQYDTLHVYTSIDRDIQIALARSMQGNLPQSIKPSNGDKIEMSGVIINPKTGAIVATQGGVNFLDTHFNRSLFSRQPTGSLITPLYIAKAVDDGYDLSDSVHRDLKNQMATTRIDSAQLTLYDLALSHSAAGGSWLYSRLGERSMARFFRSLGLRFAVHDLRLALGRGHASPLELARAYAPILFGSALGNAHTIKRIVGGDDRIIWQQSSHAQQHGLVTPETAYSMSYILTPIDKDSTWAPLATKLGASGKIAVDKNRRNLRAVMKYGGYMASFWVGAEFGKVRLATRGKEEHAKDIAVKLLTDLWQLSPPFPQRSVLKSGKVPASLGFRRIPRSHARGPITVPVILPRI